MMIEKKRDFIIDESSSEAAAWHSEELYAFVSDRLPKFILCFAGKIFGFLKKIPKNT